MPSPQPDAELRRFLRRLPLALVAAAAMWLAIRPLYDPFLCRSGEIAARMVEFPKVAKIHLAEGSALVGRTDLRADSAWLKLPLTQIHFNAVPFLALVLALPGALARRYRWRVLAAFGILVLSHILALVANVKVFYAAGLGEWSRANYGDAARAFYGALRYFFDIPLTFTLPLILWAAALWERVAALVGMAPEAVRTAPRRRG